MVVGARSSCQPIPESFGGGEIHDRSGVERDRRRMTTAMDAAAFYIAMAGGRGGGDVSITACHQCGRQVNGRAVVVSFEYGAVACTGKRRATLFWPARRFNDGASEWPRPL